MRLDDLVNAEAERTVIATILFHPDGLELFHKLADRDIASSQMRMVFAAIAQEVGGGRRPTPFTVAPYLPREAFHAQSPAHFVAGLSQFSDPDKSRDCLASVRDMAARRALVEAAEILGSDAWNADISPADLGGQAMRHLDGIVSATRSSAGRSLMFSAAADELLEGLTATGSADFVDTGLIALNRAMGGWPRGEMTIVAGRPSMGKSAVLFSAARQAADRGVNVLIFALEMRRQAVMARMLSDVAWSEGEDDSVPYELILRRDLSERQHWRLRNLFESVRGYSMRIDDTSGLTAAEIHLRCQKFAGELEKAGKRLDLVMVDHLGKVRASDRYAGNMVHETGEKSDAFMHMAKNLDVAMVVAHQLNRGPEGREERRPVLADLRDTGNLEQDAHTVLFPFREAYYLERQRVSEDGGKKNGGEIKNGEVVRKGLLEKLKNKMEISVAKNRNGPCCIVELQAFMGSNAIRDNLNDCRSDSSRA
jgi:replicative DNA helicase